MNNLKKTISDILTIARRSLLKLKHNPEQFADVIIMPVFFMLVFAFLFGGAIAGDTKAYLPILIPGILAQTLLGISSATGTAINTDMEKGIFDRFKSLPMARIAPLAGSLVADIPRYAISAAFAILTGYLIGWRPEAGFGAVLVGTLFMIFVTFSISWIFATIGLLVNKAATIQVFSQMIMMILTFMSNAFVPTETLPKVLQTFTRFNPVTHMIAALREIFATGAIGFDFWLSLGMGVAMILIFAPITLRIYNKKI
ncbi:MAG: ABC transporter permease [Turicibacter sp.]|nr:ABC transporter permease [Turicibacter sp.]